MSLRAKEWLLLPEDEQKRRADEVSPHECFLLRTHYAEIHFTEEEKANMTQEERDEFLKLPTEDEILEDKKNGLRQMKLLKLIPDEVTYEEWEKASYPIGWRNQENKNEV